MYYFLQETFHEINQLLCNQHFQVEWGDKIRSLYYLLYWGVYHCLAGKKASFIFQDKFAIHCYFVAVVGIPLEVKKQVIISSEQ